MMIYFEEDNSSTRYVTNEFHTILEEGGGDV